jgi:hypothetical protein
MPKKVAGNIYVHRDYVDGVVPADVVQAGIGVMQLHGFPTDYTYVRYDPKLLTAVMFGWCIGWMSLPEPVVDKTMKVSTLYRACVLTPAGSNPYIIHGKHLFVNEDPGYTGFDVEAARKRFESYQDADWIDRSRMGRVNWWRENAVDRLREVANA